MEYTRINGNLGVTGGGLAVENGSSPTLTDGEIAGNEALNAGGAWIDASGATFDGVTFWENLAVVSGGALYVSDGTVHVSSSWLHTNETYLYGGAVYLVQSEAVFEAVELTGNETQASGGAIYALDSALEASGVRLVRNEAATDGGAVVIDASDVTMTNAVVDDNEAGDHGGGLYVHDASPELVNVILTANEAAAGGGIYVDGGAPAVSYGDVFDNAPDSFAGMVDPTGTSGNIALDPQYVDAAAADPLDRDYHLGLASPCIDAGDPAVADPDGTTSDMGAYGGAQADQWDVDADGAPEWWHAGPYDAASDPAAGLDCDDHDDDVYPGNGC